MLLTDRNFNTCWNSNNHCGGNKISSSIYV
jgi:hypothetical protein